VHIEKLFRLWLIVILVDTAEVHLWQWGADCVIVCPQCCCLFLIRLYSGASFGCTIVDLYVVLCSSFDIITIMTSLMKL